MTNTPNQLKPLELAKLFHDTYEELAVKYNYETRLETREFNRASKNGMLMIETCRIVLESLDTPPTHVLIERGELERMCKVIPVHANIELHTQEDAAQLLVHMRKKAGMTQVQMAVKLGVMQSAISKIERGSQQITIHNLLEYASACGCTLSIGVHK